MMFKRVTCHGKQGTITGVANAYIIVTLDNGSDGYYHPKDLVYHQEIVKKPPIPANKWRSKLRWRRYVEFSECHPGVSFGKFLHMREFWAQPSIDN